MHDVLQRFKKVCDNQKSVNTHENEDAGNQETESVDIQEPTTPIPIDAKPRRLLFKDDYAEIFQEVLRCEYLCRQRNLRYDRVRYLGDYDLRKRKEFLLDYLYSLCDRLNDR